MFFLRCLFWLGLVYASISWKSGTFDTSPLPAAASRMMSDAIAGLGQRCRQQPDECVADAARLTAMIDGGDPSTTRDQGAETSAGPVPDPRRHRRPAILTSRP